MVTDAARLGDVGHDFIRFGPMAAYAVAKGYLRDRVGDKALPAEEAAGAARVFIDGFSADLQLRALPGDVAGSAERDRRIETAVRFFAIGLRRCVDAPRHGEQHRSGGGNR